jgi:branched-chain amino acid transport system substrate-binding protein
MGQTKSRILAGCSLLLALLLVIAGCGGGNNAGTPSAAPKTAAAESTNAEEFVLGSLMSTSGASNGMGGEALKGVEYAVKEINEKGGFEVAGKKYKITLKQYDDQSNPQVGVSSTERLINENKAKVIFLSPSSTSALAEAGVTEKNKVIGLVTVAAANALTDGNNKYIFRNTPTAVEAETAKAKYAIEKLGIKNFAIVARNDDWGKGGAVEFKKSVEKFGGKIVAEEYFKPGTTDFYSLLAKIKDAKPDAIDVMAIQNDGIPFVKQAKEVGITAKIFGAVVWNSGSFIEALGSAAEGINAYSDASTSVNDKISGFVKQFETSMGVKSQTYDKNNYDFVYMLTEAMKAAGTTSDTDKIRDAMLKLNYKGVNGDYSFQPNGQGIVQVNVTEVKGGKPVPVMEIPGKDLLK